MLDKITFEPVYILIFDAIFLKFLLWGYYNQQCQKLLKNLSKIQRKFAIWLVSYVAMSLLCDL